MIRYAIIGNQLSNDKVFQALQEATAGLTDAQTLPIHLATQRLNEEDHKTSALPSYLYGNDSVESLSNIDTPSQDDLKAPEWVAFLESGGLTRPFIRTYLSSELLPPLLVLSLATTDAHNTLDALSFSGPALRGCVASNAQAMNTLVDAHLHGPAVWERVYGGDAEASLYC